MTREKAESHIQYIETNIYQNIKGKTIRYTNGSNERIRNEAFTALDDGANLMHKYLQENYELVNFYAKSINVNSYMCEKFEYDHVEEDVDFILEQLKLFVDKGAV